MTATAAPVRRDWAAIHFDLMTAEAELAALDAACRAPKGREADVLRVVAGRLLAKASLLDEAQS